MSANIIPNLRYEDAPAAIDWLCRAFGFERHLVVPDERGVIVHAQLVFEGGMIMLAAAQDAPFGKLQKTPHAVGGIVTQSPYIIVRDVDAHCEQAVNAGATIVLQPVDQDYGGRGYSCTDPEGYLWNFGSYDPWGEA